jgi:hypothetical protein
MAIYGNDLGSFMPKILCPESGENVTESGNVRASAFSPIRRSPNRSPGSLAPSHLNLQNYKHPSLLLSS